ncbi:MAG TPA: hypothetical protein VLM37_07630 [Fibrobacteraceae bacterium]|nr:hypothetical protein [Fibrobacteraceae bacterium]
MNLFLNPPSSWSSPIRQLHAAWEGGRFPQAILLDGPAGIGKKKLAMDLCAFLTCTSAEGRPCGHCFSCKLAYDPGASDHWLLPLVLEAQNRENVDKVNEATSALLSQVVKNPYHTGLIPAAATISVHQVRHLWDRISYAASGERVFIIAEADCMNDNAANALLKTLEEVPPHTYFILTCSGRQRLLQTIQSRCMPLRLPPLAAQEMFTILHERGMEEPDADLLGLSMGSVGRAMQCLERDFPTVRQQALDFLNLCFSRNWSRLFRAMDLWFGKDLDTAIFFLDVLAALLNDLSRKAGNVPPRLPSCAAQLNLPQDPSMPLRWLSQLEDARHRLEERRGSISVVLQTFALRCA